MTAIAARTVKPAGFVGSTRKRSDVRAFCVHMAEGNNVSGYLSRREGLTAREDSRRVRSVSVQYTVEADGTIVAMVPELRVAGSLNPRALRTTNDPDGFYGAKHAKAALKGLWPNPNKGVIAIEVAGKATVGPNPRQVDALAALFKDCQRRYPGIVPLGHRDFQSVKRCPGKTSAMRKAFARMGGHGLAHDASPTPKPDPTPKPPVPTDPDDLEELRAENEDLRAGLRRIRAEVDDLLGEDQDA